MPNFRITIDVNDVSGEDIDMLAEDIREDHGEAFDAGQEGFVVRVSQKVGDNYFGRDPGDDVIE